MKNSELFEKYMADFYDDDFSEVAANVRSILNNCNECDFDDDYDNVFNSLPISIQNKLIKQIKKVVKV